jgi:hypothetical protein
MTEHHAKYSPSKLPRIILCPGSVYREKGRVQKESEYALVGTICHRLTELHLVNKSFTLAPSFINVVEQEYKYKFDKDDLDAVQEVLDWVAALYLKHADAKETLHLVEQHVTLAGYAKDLKCAALVDVYGTLDFLLRFDDILYVIDWKYGKGVEVYPDSSQLLAYGAGALHHSDIRYLGFNAIQDIRLVIGQPKLYAGEHFKFHNIVVGDLHKFLRDDLTPKLQDLSTITPSKKACMWCLAKNDCPEKKAMQVEIAANVFAIHAELPKGDMSLDELSQVLKDIPFLKSCISDLEKHAFVLLKSGKSVPDWKLVHGRSIRQWVNEKAAKLYYVNREDIDPDDLVTTKFKSPTQMEKLIGKKNITDDDLSLVHKPEGKPTLVLESDRRDAIEFQTAEEKFGEFV